MKARSVGTFVQVSESLAINMASVTETTFSLECIYIYQEPRQESEHDDTPIVLRDESRLAFLEWWERQAELTLIAQSPQYL